MTLAELPDLYNPATSHEVAELLRPFKTVSYAERLAVEWLIGYANAKTRNAYAIDIGLPGEIRAAIPGGPARPKGLPADAWIPWATANAIEPCGELTVRQVQTYAHLLTELHPEHKSIRRRRWFSLCGYYSHLRRCRLVYCDPNDLIGNRTGRRNLGLAGTDPSTTVPIEPNQTRAMFVAVQLDGTAHQVRNRALIAVFAATAARVEELVGLDLGDYHRDSPTGGGKVLLDGKGDKKRWQLLPTAECDLLDAYLDGHRVAPATGTDLALVGQVGNRRTIPQPLFTTGTGTRLHVDTVPALLRRIANLPQDTDRREEVRAAARELRSIKDKLHPHQWRHAYAVTAEAAGKPVTQIQADLGHATLATTQSYLHAAKVAKNSAAQVVSDIYHAGVVDLAALEETDTVTTAQEKR